MLTEHVQDPGEVPHETKKARQVRVHETFLSIQGEAPGIGVPTAFARLFGCNRRCTWCDTGYVPNVAQYRLRHNAAKYPLMNAAELWDLLNSMGTFKAIEITGGEPLLYPAFLDELLDEACKTFECEPKQHPFKYRVETNAELDEAVENFLRANEWFLVASPKLAGSGQESPNILETFKRAALHTDRMAIKMVIASQDDYNRVQELTDLSGLKSLYLQPAFDNLPWFALWDMYQRSPIQADTVHLGIQLHKILDME